MPPLIPPILTDDRPLSGNAVSMRRFRPLSNSNRGMWEVMTAHVAHARRACGTLPTFRRVQGAHSRDPLARNDGVSCLKIQPAMTKAKRPSQTPQMHPHNPDAI